MTNSTTIVALLGLLSCLPGVSIRPASAQGGPAAPLEPGEPTGQGELGEQVDPLESGRIRVFLDCGACDVTYLRENVTFVDYVRDRTVADVHVLVTVQGTGGGGTLWTANFIGIGRFAGQDRVTTFASPQASTLDDRRREFARIFRLGVVGYALNSSVVGELDVIRRGVPQGAARTVAADDPWDFWVFRVNGSANMNGQQTRDARTLFVSGSASRVTEHWKVSVSANRNTNTTTFEIAGRDPIVSRRDSWNVNSLLVKSLGDHWAVGGRATAQHSTFSNTKRALTAAPGIEFDLFPYRESSRRSLTMAYAVGATRLDYIEATVFDRLSETVPHHAFEVSLGLRQPWGTVGAAANFAQHLNQLDRRRMSVSGQADVRLFRGFSLTLSGGYDKIADQIALIKGGATTEQVLLNLQQLRTDYSYRFNVGISYSFGSIFNSVVNPRFNGAPDLSF